LIAFVGSVFSPYYHWAQAKAKARGAVVSPDNHCALNVAIYSPGQKRWTMTERSAACVQRDTTHFQIKHSQLRWDGSSLVIDIQEHGMPIPFPVRGQVRISADRFFHHQSNLDAEGRHRWGPLAPAARIEVTLDAPQLRWKGSGYLDSNEGDEPLASAFHRWDWSRATMSDGSAAVLYDLEPTGQDDRLIALRFRPDGQTEPFEVGPRMLLKRSAWAVSRATRTDPDGRRPRLVRTLEDTPFYVRSEIRTSLLGERVTAMHESLYAPRLRSPVVRWMLPWRMPRIDW
jgi:carotenoid 1,2-hydratase